MTPAAIMAQCKTKEAIKKKMRGVGMCMSRCALNREVGKHGLCPCHGTDENMVELYHESNGMMGLFYYCNAHRLYAYDMATALHRNGDTVTVTDFGEQ